MRVPASMASAYDASFESLIAEFAVQNGGLLPGRRHRSARTAGCRARDRAAYPESFPDCSIARKKPRMPRSTNAGTGRKAPTRCIFARRIFCISCPRISIESLRSGRSFRAWAFVGTAGDTLRGVEFRRGAGTGWLRRGEGAEKHAPFGSAENRELGADRAGSRDARELGSRWSRRPIFRHDGAFRIGGCGTSTASSPRARASCPGTRAEPSAPG